MKNLILCLCGLLLCCIYATAEDITYQNKTYKDSATLHEIIYNADGTRDLYFLEDTVDVKLIINDDLQDYNLVVTDTSNINNFDFEDLLSNNNVFLFDRWATISAFMNNVKSGKEWRKWIKKLPLPKIVQELPDYSIMKYAENKKPAFYTSVIIKADLIDHISSFYEDDDDDDEYFPFIYNPGTFYRVVIPVWDSTGLPLKQHDSTSR